MKARPLAPMPPKQTLPSAQEDVLAQIEIVKEPKTKRLYSGIFMDAPSKREYPEYYSIIKRVICLNEIKVCCYLDGLTGRGMYGKDYIGRGRSSRLMSTLYGPMLLPLMRMEVRYTKTPRFSRYVVRYMTDSECFRESPQGEKDRDVGTV